MAALRLIDLGGEERLLQAAGMLRRTLEVAESFVCPASGFRDDFRAFELYRPIQEVRLL